MFPLPFTTIKFSRLQWIVHLTALVLLIWLLFDYVTDNLTVNPIQAATIRTGRYALYFLVVSLACTPLNTLFGWRETLKIRRPLGLYAFIFAAIHVFIFAVWDYALEWEFLLEDLFTKQYTLVGLATFTILLLLAITSFQWWMRRLGKNWKRLHRLVYLAAVLAVVHYAWAVKGDLLQLSGDILRPFAFAVAVTLLLVVRIPLVRQTAVRWRLRLLRPAPSSSRQSQKSRV
jgi:methionine sulfoxide reductase heme-binding subunit